MAGGYSLIVFTDHLLDQFKTGNPYETILKPSLDIFSRYQLRDIGFYLRHSYFETIENFFYYYPTTEKHHCLEV
jgi:hypothetical protein